MPANPVRGAVDSLANSRGRSTQHILIGLGLTVGAVAVSALVARMNAPSDENYEAYSDYEELVPPETKPPSKVFAAVWPPLFTALTLSGLRIWNAPAAGDGHRLVRHGHGLCLARPQGRSPGRQPGRPLRRLDRLRQRTHRGTLAEDPGSPHGPLGGARASP